MLVLLVVPLLVVLVVVLYSLAFSQFALIVIAIHSLYHQMLTQKLIRPFSATARRPMSTFARIISFKVESVERGQEIDQAHDEKILPLVKQLDGLVSIDRFLCGGELVRV